MASKNGLIAGREYRDVGESAVAPGSPVYRATTRCRDALLMMNGKHTNISACHVFASCMLGVIQWRTSGASAPWTRKEA